MSNDKVLAVASLGGHWTQLLRITRGLERSHKLCYCSTHPQCANMVSPSPFHLISDFSRWDAWKMPLQFFRLIRIIRDLKPGTLITTGAAPGLTALLAAKLCNVKTVWIDSIANVECLSMSGKIALLFADRIYTQWPDLADGKKIIYAGNVF